MKAMKLISCCGIWLALCWMAVPATAQISSGGTPPSFSVPLTGTVPTVTMPPVDNQAEMTLDQQAGKDAPYRFAVQLDVNLNLDNSGAWTTLANGDRVWRLRIYSQGAYSIGLIYNDWYIPKGGQLFIYNDDHSRVIGAFTSANNWDGPTNTTQHVAGDAITLEYLEPTAITGQSRLSISTVCHAYRNLFGVRATENFGDSGPCEININCPVGATWQDQKRGVALLVINNSGACSGSLINTTALDFRPLFLTAHHCTGSFSDSYILYFNYESPNCSNINGPTNQTVANGYLDATYIASDFSLIGFSSAIPINYSPFFNGWNRTNTPATNSTCIHHPEADIKKISHDNDAPGSYGWNAPGDTHWWIHQWDLFGSSVGVTEPGSSGSPLFNQNHVITGQLHGGASYCGNPVDDFYGKVYYSWTGGGASNSRLSDWLDPASTGVTALAGLNATVAANDVCPGYYIYSLPYSSNGNTNLANDDYTHQVYGNAPDVVYTFVGQSCETSVTVSLCGSGYDTAVDIRSGGACPGNTLVASNDDFCGLQSQVTFTAAPLTNYYIIVYGYASNSGLFTLNVTGTPTAPVPTNDTCPGTSITSLPYNGSGSTCNANASFANCVTLTSPDVLYNLNLSTCQTVTVSLCGSNFDTQLSIRAGSSCPGNTTVACNDDACGLQSEVTFVAQANTNYYILIAGYAGNTGNYQIAVTGTPFVAPNDVCPGTSISSLPYSDAGNTSCANNDFNNCIGGTSPDVFYTMNISTCQTVTASLCGSGYDTAIEIRSGGACPGDVQVICNDDNLCDGNFSFQSTAVFVAEAGVNYYINVHGYATNSGPYVLNVTGVPFVSPNDVCPGTTIASLPYTDNGNTRCANNDYTWSCPAGGSPDSRDVIYNLTLTNCQTVTASLCGSGYDTGIEVRTDGACPGATSVACNDDNCGLQSEVQWVAMGGVTYYILVDGYYGAAGPFTLNVTGTPFAPPNDVCPGTAITSLPYTDNGDTRCASNDYPWSCPFGGNPDSREVFYSLVLPECDSVTVSLCGSGYDTGVEVRTGGACPGGTSVACNDDYCGLQSQVSFTAQAGVSYYILVDGYFGAAGLYTINVSGTPCSGPQAPDSLVVLSSGANINLYWPPVPGATGYKVYRKVTPDVSSAPADFLADAPSNTFVDVGVINAAAKYFYLVTAVSAGAPAASLPPENSEVALDDQMMKAKMEHRGDRPVSFIPYESLNTHPDPNATKPDAVKTPSADVLATWAPVYVDQSAISQMVSAKTKAPADETLRVENFYVPAYTEFATMSAPNPNKKPEVPEQH